MPYCIVGVSVGCPRTASQKFCVKKITVIKWIFGLQAAFCKLNVIKSMFLYLLLSFAIARYTLLVGQSPFEISSLDSYFLSFITFMIL